jgi:hypothetical protein
VKGTTVSVAQVATAPEAVLPERVQEALGELVGAAKEGCSRCRLVWASACWAS